jgi:N-methylhydantoinase B/oxoprolinase/acetone carboxylase alpha subunit
VAFTLAGQPFIPEMRSKLEKQVMDTGDSVLACTPGGGGFGDPLQRDPDALESDLNQGYVSQASAERDYGAVIATVQQVGEHRRYKIDRLASAKRRAQLAAARTR